MPKNNVIILKQVENGYSTCNKTLNGIVRIENFFGVTELSLSLINVSTLASGKFFLYLFGNANTLLSFELPLRPINFRKVLENSNGFEEGFACALTVVDSNIPLTIAFGKTENFNFSINQAKKLIADNCLVEKKQSAKNCVTFEKDEKNNESVFNPSSNCEPVLEYNDEAVATVNYYELEEELAKKVDKINRWSDEGLRNENGNANDCRQQEEKEEQNDACFGSNEASPFASQKQEFEPPFFLTASKELELLFNKFPCYDKLSCYFPDSKFVRINYDEERFYIVGVVKEEKKEKYICYGIPAVYSKTPPEELKGYCSFIPLSIFDMHGEGFWMMFQDATTGECIFPK